MFIHFCLYSMCEKISESAFTGDLKILTSLLTREKLVIRVYECYELTQHSEVVHALKKSSSLLSRIKWGPLKCIRSAECLRKAWPRAQVSSFHCQTRRRQNVQPLCIQQSIREICSGRSPVHLCDLNLTTMKCHKLPFSPG